MSRENDDDMTIEDPLAGVDAERTILHRGSSPQRTPAGATAWVEGSEGLEGRNSAPANLLAFVRCRPERDAAEELGLSRKQIQRLKGGYWPQEPRKILEAWSAYRGRGGATANRWVLRCVYPDGVVRQGRHVYTAQQLGARVGELVAVARSVDGALIAQPLQPPMERFALERVKA